MKSKGSTYIRLNLLYYFNTTLLLKQGATYGNWENPNFKGDKQIYTHPSLYVCNF